MKLEKELENEYIREVTDCHTYQMYSICTFCELSAPAVVSRNVVFKMKSTNLVI